MTVSSVLNKVRDSGNGVTVAFPASIKIFAATDITVTILDSTTDAVINALILNDGGALGFTVVFDTEAETLTVTTNTAPITGEDIQIVRVLPQTQTTDFPRATKFPAKANENGLDKSTMILQDQQEALDRAFKVPVTSSVSDPTAPTPEDRRCLVWDGVDGNLINSTFDPDQAQADATASATAAGTSASNAATSEANSATSASNAATSETNAAQSAIDAQAAVGAVKVSVNDTTAGDLETKILSSGLVGLSTQNDGGNETRTIDVPKADQATAEAGVNDTDAMTALKTSQAIAALEAAVFKEEFVSAEQTITATGGLTLAHGLGGTPKTVTTKLICKVADNGYSIGDIVVLDWFLSSTTTGGLEWGHALYIDGTNVGVRYAIGSGGFVYSYINKGTGNTGNMTNTSWRLIVEAYF